MNKKLLVAGSLVAATALFTVAAFAAPSSYTGYEALKEVLKSNQASHNMIKNGTFTGEYSLSDNDKVIFELAGSAAFNEDGKQGSGHFEVEADQLKRAANFYANDKEVYFEDLTNGLNYKVLNSESSDLENRYSHYDNASDHEFDATGEAFMDFMMGDLKSQVQYQKQDDGSKNFTLDLDQNEIPVIVQTLASAAITDSNKKSTHFDSDTEKHEAALAQMKKIPFFNGFENLQAQGDLSKLLTSNIVIRQMAFQLSVDANNELKGMSVSFSVSGLDQSGKEHVVVMTGHGDVSKINESTVKTFNPEGKQVEIIDPSKFE